MNPAGQGLVSRIWQTLLVVVVFAVTLRAASAVIAPAVATVTAVLVVLSVYMLVLGRRH
jgi:hypothetical protein